MTTRDDCIFCKIIAGQIPCTRVYEDEKVLAFMDIAPLSRGHFLVIPKEHVETISDIDPELYGHMATVLCRVAQAGRNERYAAQREGWQPGGSPCSHAPRSARGRRWSHDLRLGAGYGGKRGDFSDSRDDQEAPVALGPFFRSKSDIFRQIRYTVTAVSFF